MTKVKDELIRVKQILKAAEMNVTIKGEPEFRDTPPLIENVLSMCMKEAVTNVVKHSYGTACLLEFEQLSDALIIRVKDDGIGIPGQGKNLPGNGLAGIRERLEFVNGSLSIEGDSGTTLTIRVPIVIKRD